MKNRNNIIRITNIIIIMVVTFGYSIVYGYGAQDSATDTILGGNTSMPYAPGQEINSPNNKPTNPNNSGQTSGSHSGNSKPIGGGQSSSKHTAGEVISEADKFLQTGENKANNLIKKEKLHELSTTIYNILLVVAIIVAVLLGAVLGIRFMIEGASGKAEVQKALIPYIAGCAVVFGAFAIWKIVVTVLQGMQ